MSRVRQKKRVKIFPNIFIFILAAFVVFFGIQFITKTGIFKVYGIVSLDADLPESDREFVLRVLANDEVKLDHDVNVSFNDATSPSASANSILTDIYVPVADFYDSRSLITSAELENLSLDSAGDTKLISIADLDSSVKLLAVDNEYYLDTFDSGAIFHYVTFDTQKPEEVMPLIEAGYDKTFPTKDTVLSFAQTGVTALSRKMHTKLQSVGNSAYFAENIKDFLSSKDITHTSNESSFTNKASGSNICSAWKMTDALTSIGLDIVELTGNHNNDCGAQANLDSIAWYQEQGIKVVGGGKNATEAAKPLELSEKSTNITLFAYNQSTGGATKGNTPGANQYYGDKAAAEIKAAKDRGDFVIVDMQYYECYCYPSGGYVEYPTCDKPINVGGSWADPDQKTLFHQLIDYGADIVVGVSAHQPQTYERYNNGAIYYGLGNLFFDQTAWPGTERGIILTHYFQNGKLLQTRLTPTVYDKSLQVKLMDEETSSWFIARLNAAL